MRKRYLILLAKDDIFGYGYNEVAYVQFNMMNEYDGLSTGKYLYTIKKWYQL